MNVDNMAIYLILILALIPPIPLIVGYKKLINYIPTFCTSVGILFSFWLLYSTLREIKTDELSKIVEQLSSKFLYSIIGIAFSIVWTIIIKILEEKQDNAESRSNIWKQKDPQEILWLLWQTGLGIERKFEVYAQSQNDNHSEIKKVLTSGSNELRDQLKVLNYNSNDIRDQLHILNSNAISIKKAIEESSETQSKKATEQQETLDNISDFMQSAGGSLKSLLDDLKNQLENNIKAMGSDAAKKAAELHRIFEDFLKDRASQMEEKMAKDIKEVHEKIHPALNSISEVTNNSANELKEALNGINSVLGDMQISLARQINEQVQTAENNVENSTKKFEEITISKANELSTEFDKIHNVLQDLNSGLQKSIDGILKEKEEQIRKTFDHLEDLRLRSANILTQTTEKFAESVAKYGDIQHNNEEIIKRLETQIISIDGLQKTSEKQIVHWESRVDEMKDVKNRVADIANTIEQLEALNQKLGLFISQKN